MKKVVLEREPRGDDAGSYTSTGLEEVIEVEHLKKILFERELWGMQQEAIEAEKECSGGVAKGGGGGGGGSGGGGVGHGLGFLDI